MSQWKQHGGASRNRNLKATSVLFTRSNFWQRGDNLELYHDNDGSTTYVGIGTTKPFSRLSFGDTAVQRRVDYANDGNFALCEKEDGSEATGIGFYERFKNFDPTANRLFTGLKFIVNRDNNNTMDTSGQNIKMLLRDDGKLILGHNPDESKALQPYNVAMLDVSGNIRASKYMILSKQTTITGYKPPGGMRFNGQKMIYTDENGFDHTIKVESDVAQTGDWAAGQDEFGNPLVYLSNVNVGVLKNLFDRDCFEAEFNVEGRVTIGDQEWMKTRVYNDTAIFDNSSNGIISVWKAVGIGTHHTKAALDINRISNYNVLTNEYVKVPFIKVGLDDVEVSGNSIGIGKFVQVKTSMSFAMGENILMMGNDDVQRGFVFGKDNKLLFGSNCYIYGVNNLIHNNFDPSKNSIANFVVGSNNRVFDASHVFVSGQDCTLGHISAAPEFSCSYSTVFGKENFVFSRYSFTSGFKNSVITGRQNVAIGSLNDISDCKTTIILGTANIAKDSSANTIIGTSITSNQNTIGSFLTGKSHAEDNGQYNTITGRNHIVSFSQDNILSGKANKATTTLTSSITGDSNIVNVTTNTSVMGKDNNVGNTNQSVVAGHENTVSFATHSFVMGKENSETSGTGNMIIGKENTTINADNTLVSGHIHNINNADESIFSGKSHTATNIDRTAMLGFGHQAINVTDGLIGGNQNNVTNFVNNSIVYGESNIVTANSAGPGTVKNNAVFGKQNVVQHYTHQNITSGDRNVLQETSNSTVLGISNNVLRTDDVIVSGRTNKLIDVSSSTVFGKQNDVSGSSMNDLITGKSNLEFNGKQNLIAGEANNVKNSSSSLIQGVSHVVLDGSNNVSFGENNQLTRNKGSLSFGRKNILTDVSNTVVLGSHNNILNNTTSGLTSGYLNNVNNGLRNTTLGETNDIDNGVNN